MALQDELFNIMLDAGAGAIVEVSLHTADPGSTGANEVVGAPYARQPITWAAASGAAVSSSAEVDIPVPGGTTVSHLGCWDASATPVWLGGIALSTPESFGADGTYTLTSATLTAANAA